MSKLRGAIQAIAAITGTQVYGVLADLSTVNSQIPCQPGYQLGDLNRFAERKGREIREDWKGYPRYDPSVSVQPAPTPSSAPVAAATPSEAVAAAPAPAPAPIVPTQQRAIAPAPMDPDAAIDAEIARDAGVSLETYRANPEDYTAYQGENLPL